MYFSHLSFTVTKYAGLFQLAKMRTRGLLKQIAFYTHSNENVELSNSELQSLLFLQPSYPDTNCLLFDFSKNESLNEKRLIQIRFNFKQTDNLDTTALVRIVDRNTLLDRASYSYSGVSIKTDLRESKKLRYVVTLKQNIYVEEDESKGCKNYPFNGFADYGSCDEDFVSRSLREVGPSHFVPFWATTNWSLVTNLTVLSHEEVYNMSVLWNKNYECIFDGTSVSDCPVPCTTTIAIAKEEDVTTMEGGSAIDITFFDTILVTTTSFPTFSFSDALAKLGGAMGLWLGIGIMQVFEILLSLRQRMMCFHNKQ